MEKSKSDIVIGSKGHPQSTLRYPARRMALSHIYQVMVRILFNIGVTDTQVGLKLVKHEALGKIIPRLVVRGYTFDLELLANAHRLGYKLTKAPTTLSFRRDGRWGRMRFQDLARMFIDVLRVFYRMHMEHY